MKPNDIIEGLENKKQELVLPVEQVLCYIKIENEERKQNPKTKKWYSLFKRNRNNVPKKGIFTHDDCMNLYNSIVSTVDKINNIWTAFQNDNIEYLKGIIKETAWSETEKTDCYLKAMICPIISFNSSGILANIIKCGDEVTPDSLNNYIDKLKRELLDSINIACKEQEDIYREILDKLNQ